MKSLIWRYWLLIGLTLLKDIELLKKMTIIHQRKFDLTLQYIVLVNIYKTGVSFELDLIATDPDVSIRIWERSYLLEKRN